MKIPCLILSLGLLLIGGAAAAAQNPDAIAGKWLNEEKDAHIEIYPCEGKFCGKIVWLQEPNYPDNDPNGLGGKPKVDRKNPDPSQQNRTLLGMTFMSGFTPSSENLWEGGYIYNPEDGKTYKCKLTLDNPDRLKVRGFLGISLIGKTTIWTRLK